MTDDSEATPKLHIDSDWKAQAQAEKDRLAEKEAARKEDARQNELPKASFQTLVEMLASQAIMGLGTMADKESGGVILDLPGAKFSIDLLAVIQEKTKGNLSDEETKSLTQLLTELRNRFVQMATLLERQMAAGGAPKVDAGPGAKSAPKIEMP